MNDTIFQQGMLQQMGSTAQNLVSTAIQLILFIIQQVVQMILKIAIPLSLFLFLIGLILYFSHLNRRMGRDFIVLSLALLIISQIVQI